MAQQTWTDPNYKVVFKTVHVDELHDAINAWEDAYGIAETTFTDDEPTTNTKITPLLFTEMQDALDVLYQLTDASDFTWTTAAGYQFGKTAGVDGGDPLVEEVRDNMNFMQDQKCYQCDLCDTEGCTCDSECYNDSCDTCYDTCYPKTCSCNPGCYNDACTVCNARCHSSYSAKTGCNLCYPHCYNDACTSCDGDCYADACSCDLACDGDVCDLCDAQCNVENCVQCHVANYRYPW